MKKWGWLSLQKGLLALHLAERFDLVAWGLFWLHVWRAKNAVHLSHFRISSSVRSGMPAAFTLTKYMPVG